MDEADTVLSLEVEEKVRKRIRDELVRVLSGGNFTTPIFSSESELAQREATFKFFMTKVTHHLLTDPQFISAISRRIGDHMANNGHPYYNSGRF